MSPRMPSEIAGRGTQSRADGWLDRTGPLRWLQKLQTEPGTEKTQIVLIAVAVVKKQKYLRVLDDRLQGAGYGHQLAGGFQGHDRRALRGQQVTEIGSARRGSSELVMRSLIEREARERLAADRDGGRDHGRGRLFHPGAEEPEHAPRGVGLQPVEARQCGVEILRRHAAVGRP